MSYKNINVDDLIESVQKSLEADKTISTGLKTLIGVLVFLVTSLLQSKKTNSNNSSIPPSQDPNREKFSKEGTGKKRGGQKGRTGVTLECVSNPDEEVFLPLDINTLSSLHTYSPDAPEKRQVFDLIIQRNVIEYSAQAWKDENGKRYVAEFPLSVKHRVQYGEGVKAHAVYLHQYQMLPVQRITEYFTDKLCLPISDGSVINWTEKASERLEELQFPELLTENLLKSDFLHLDETGVNIKGKREWLHVHSNDKWTCLFPHKKRGKEAMDERGVLEDYTGVMIHDHWKPYYSYRDKTHSLCNAHHLRELQKAIDTDMTEKKQNSQWALEMKRFLIETNILKNTEIKNSGDILSEKQQQESIEKYREILQKGDEECPAPKEKDRGLDKNGNKKRGRLKKTKSRNLLERLKYFEDDVLRFMTQKNIPFTNNQGERDLRMTKVQQKISGCFQSEKGAKNFALIRSFLSSAKKQNFSPSSALNLLFEGKLIF